VRRLQERLDRIVDDWCGLGAVPPGDENPSAGRPEGDRAGYDVGSEVMREHLGREGDANATRDEPLHRPMVVDLCADPWLETRSPARTHREGMAERATRPPDPGHAG
jgi:hypothetical protein